MLRRKNQVPPAEPRRRVEINVDDLPRFDDELSPRELLGRLTDAVEQKIDASFARKSKIQKEHA
jgi:hypothetical protein